MKFIIFKLGYVVNFNLNRQFRSFGPNLPRCVLGWKDIYLHFNTSHKINLTIKFSIFESSDVPNLYVKRQFCAKGCLIVRPIAITNTKSHIYQIWRNPQIADFSHRPVGVRFLMWGFIVHNYPKIFPSDR